ncbi:ribonuclease P protein component [Gillisia sp. Hel_I_86]|uniref:ribonuclease P protein component n=1 Tax=Gillisia sp. Hel_I_86 TaxID=1249981 RepID=UPI00119A3D88|nr:ribonuclease P protein component [Gillisia sp. Hel_I_86]TVZ26641.1 ribonuclease P protein component [Gillisia sp. Hel_I_86]
MSETFPASEKLKSKILIDTLFTEGNSIKQFPIKLLYHPIENPEITTGKTGVSVPKRNFKKAVERNYLKRLMREAFRKNKYLVESNLSQKYALMFIFTARKKYEAQEISDCIIQLLNKLKEKEAAHENQDH